MDPNLKGRRLVLRKSMVKFECDTSDSFEVIKVSEERKSIFLCFVPACEKKRPFIFLPGRLNSLVFKVPD